MGWGSCADAVLRPLAKLLRAGTRVVSWGGHEIRFTFSAGLCDARSPGVDNPEAVVRGADEALYRAEGQGRNRVVIAR